MAWWLILIIVIGIIVFIAIVIKAEKSFREKQAQEKRHKQEVYDEYDRQLTNLVATGYCYVNSDYLFTIYTGEQLEENKFVRRPFVCFQTPRMKRQKIAIVLPQVTNHKNHHYYSNIYIDNDAHYLNSEELLIVKVSNLWFKAKAWNESNGSLKEINQRIDEVKEFIKDSMWNKKIEWE